jgi:hypothetical protein
MKSNFLDGLELTEAERAFLDDAYTFNPANMNQSRATSEFFLAKVIGRTISRLINTIEALDQQRQKLERATLIVTTIGLGASVILLIVTACEARLAANQLLESQNYNRKSMEPYISPEADFEPIVDGQPIGFFISNAGMGPAIIESFLVYVDDKPMKSNGFQALFEAVEMSGFSSGYKWIRTSNLTNLLAGQKIMLLGFDANHTSEETSAILKEFFSHIKIHIKYSSIYTDEPPKEHDWYFPLN